MPAILVVDDEPSIRKMLTLILQRGGFTVFTAANGAQALHKYQLYKDDIDLVISDCSMPVMDGKALTTRLLSERPDLPVILLSDESDAIDFGSQSTLRFLPKPFDLKTLLSTVQSMVSESTQLSTSS